METYTIMYKVLDTYGHIQIIAKDIEEAMEKAKIYLTAKTENWTIKYIRAEYKRANE